MSENQHNPSDSGQPASQERRQDDEHTMQVARVGGKQGAEDVLRMLGVDLDNPHEAQKDFHALRSYRRVKEWLGRGAAIALAGTGASWLWAAIAEKLKG